MHIGLYKTISMGKNCPLLSFTFLSTYNLLVINLSLFNFILFEIQLHINLAEFTSIFELVDDKEIKQFSL